MNNGIFRVDSLVAPGGELIDNDYLIVARLTAQGKIVFYWDRNSDVFSHLKEEIALKSTSTHYFDLVCIRDVVDREWEGLRAEPVWRAFISARRWDPKVGWPPPQSPPPPPLPWYEHIPFAWLGFLSPWLLLAGFIHGCS